jgi:hypothetical protein
MVTSSDPAPNGPRHPGRIATLARLSRLSLLGVASVGLVLVSCSKNNESPSTSPTTASPGTTSAGNPLADAKTAAVAFFEAKAVNDYDQALANSSGAAAITVQWARDVNGPQATKGTPYEVPSVTAPNVRVQIDSLNPTSGDLFSASGFVELGFRPSGVASTTTTTAANGSADNNVFVTDMTFRDDNGHMTLDDFRLDDTPYPVSQLFISASAASTSGTTTPATTATTQPGTTLAGQPPTPPAQLVLLYRDLDGTVQYDFTFTSTLDGTKPTTASFFADATTPPAPGATGSSVTLYADPTNANTTVHALAVRPGAFPGGPGILRVVFADPAGQQLGSRDLTVPPFPPLVAQPVNQIRDRLAGTSTTSSSSTTSSTSTSTTSTTTPTTSSTSTTSTTTTLPTTTSSSSTTSTSTPSTGP